MVEEPNIVIAIVLVKGLKKGFGDLLEWADRPEDRHPQLLEHHLIEQLLIDMEQKGYITLHADS